MKNSSSIRINKIETHVLGAGYDRGGAWFAFSSPASCVCLNLYARPDGEAAYCIEVGEEYKIGDVFSFSITGMDIVNMYYDYTVAGRRCADINARLVTSIELLDGTIQYMGIISKDDYSWRNDIKLNINPQDLIIYKIHTKGFTKSRSSKVIHKGTFLGVTEQIEYLKELGINAIELMPAYEFIQNEQKNNYWGYAEGYYFSPRREYCFDKKDATYANEFKDMVTKLHQNGIEVYMEFYFSKEVEANTAIECLRFWNREYHLDGAHVICDRRIQKAIGDDSYLRSMKLMCTNWDADNSKKNLIEYNDGFQNVVRKMLKGDEDQQRDFLAAMRKNPAQAYSINYIANNNGFTLMDLFSYDRKHNEENGENNRDGADYNLSWNCGFEGHTKKKKVLELRMRLMKNAMTFLMCAQGIPLIYAGDEFGNSQNGNNNAYCQDNETGWVNWNAKTKNEEFYAFVKELIVFRKQHKALHMVTEPILSDYKYYGLPDVSYHGEKAWYPEMAHYIRYGGILTCGQYADDESNVFVAFNMHWENHKLAIPSVVGRKWKKVFDTGKESDISAKEIDIQSRTVIILSDEKNS